MVEIGFQACICFGMLTDTVVRTDVGEISSRTIHEGDFLHSMHDGTETCPDGWWSRLFFKRAYGYLPRWILDTERSRAIRALILLQQKADLIQPRELEGMKRNVKAITLYA